MVIRSWREIKQSPNLSSIPSCLNSILHVKGHTVNKSLDFLLDTGAAVSAICRDKVPSDIIDKIKQDPDTILVGANGQPLQVEGQIELPLTLGNFTAAHDFAVVKTLNVNCLLGADFLIKHETVIDCNKKALQLGPARVLTLLMSKESVKKGNVTFPSRTVLLISGNVG